MLATLINEEENMRRAPVIDIIYVIAQEKLEFSARNLELYEAKTIIIVKIADPNSQCCIASRI